VKAYKQQAQLKERQAKGSQSYSSVSLQLVGVGISVKLL
jgi:hypothetical protein